MVLPWAKHWKSMYTGSMVGAGGTVFALWGYIISNADRGRLDLNPVILHAIIGDPVKAIEEAIAYLERPDPKSRHKTRDGRRIVREGEFSFFVPCWEEYQRVLSKEERRESNRVAQAKFRGKNKDEKPSKHVPTRAEQMAGRGEWDREPVEETDREITKREVDYFEWDGVRSICQKCGGCHIDGKDGWVRGRDHCAHCGGKGIPKDEAPAVDEVEPGLGEENNGEEFGGQI